MSLCKGCGGVVGRDCFNPSECEWITRDMERRQAAGEGQIVPMHGGFIFRAHQPREEAGSDA